MGDRPTKRNESREIKGTCVHAPSWNLSQDSMLRRLKTLRSLGPVATVVDLFLSNISKCDSFIFICLEFAIFAVCRQVSVLFVGDVVII
jgi:hypothetical protein